MDKTILNKARILSTLRFADFKAKLHTKQKLEKYLLDINKHKDIIIKDIIKYKSDEDAIYQAQNLVKETISRISSRINEIETILLYSIEDVQKEGYIDSVNKANDTRYKSYVFSNKDAIHYVLGVFIAHKHGETLSNKHVFDTYDEAKKYLNE